MSQSFLMNKGKLKEIRLSKLAWFSPSENIYKGKTGLVKN